MSVAAVLAAGGAGVRAGGEKLWADIGGRPLIALTLESLASCHLFDTVGVAAPEERHELIARLAGAAGIADIRCVAGGPRRRDSVASGLDAVAGCATVCIHDAARPLCPAEVFHRVVAAAERHGAATAALPCIDTIKQVSHGLVLKTLARDSLVAVQTPQAFRAALIGEAHAASAEDASDDCVLVERLGAPVAVVDGDARNRKITLAADLDWLRHWVRVS